MGRCFGCATALDPRRSRARIAAGRVVLVCGPCSALPFPALLDPRDPAAPTASAAGEESAVVVAVPERRSRWPLVGPALAVLVTATLVASASKSSERAAVLPRVETPPPYQRKIELEEPRWSILVSRPSRRPEQWYHPVAAASERQPNAAGRRFGAERPGPRPAECGLGHCGVDLFGPRGTPIIAVADGVITRVERSREGRSGLYVRLRHNDGSETAYMHLDEVAPRVATGLVVAAGSLLGTLGRSGIHRSEPHLHFSWQAPGDLRYVDPSEHLADAVILDVIDVSLAAAPGMRPPAP